MNTRACMGCKCLLHVKEIRYKGIKVGIKLPLNVFPLCNILEMAKPHGQKAD